MEHKESPRPSRTPLFRVLRVVLFVLLALLAAVAGFVAYLSIAEFRPAAEQAAESVSEAYPGDAVALDTAYTVMSFNIGYAGLGEESDFFMDGGAQTRPSSAQIVQKNFAGISAAIAAADPDFALLQEVDRNAKRSYGLDEAAQLAALSQWGAAFAPNHVCPYVPYPLPDTIGRVEAGLLTLSKTRPAEQTRVSLPVPFRWPVRVANLKRCLLVSRIPVQGADAELVLVNLHLEAYDDGQGRNAQTQQLTGLLLSEYEKGNYVIAGGDFNQALPDIDPIRYSILREGYWNPDELSRDILPGDWQILCDDGVPTCRLLNKPYDPESPDTQFYVIDGFLCSPNVRVSGVKTLDLSFAYSDHNPVLLTFSLKK